MMFSLVIICLVFLEIGLWLVLINGTFIVKAFIDECFYDLGLLGFGGFGQVIRWLGFGGPKPIRRFMLRFFVLLELVVVSLLFCFALRIVLFLSI